MSGQIYKRKRRTKESKLPRSAAGAESVLQAVGHAQRHEQLLVKGCHPLLVDGPVENTAGAQHAPAEEERPRQPVVVDVLQEDQDHGVPAGFDHLVESLMGRESEEQRRGNMT